MPLRKLWNSICGKSKPADRTPSTDQPAAGGPATPDQQPVGAAVKPAAESPPKTSSPAVAREHKKLCRRLESLAPRSVLEIGIADGRRGLSIVSALTREGHATPVRYIAIDPFEMGPRQVSLREFHKQLREFAAKVHLVPMDVNAGLDRVVRTYGQVDVILWDQAQPPTRMQSALLERLSKPSTLILCHESGQWVETSFAAASNRSRQQAA